MPSDQSPPDEKRPMSEDVSRTTETVKTGLEREVKGARETFQDLRDAATEKASGLVGEVKEAAAAQGEKLQHTLADTLTSLAGAMRSASEHLGKDEQAQISRAVDTAAGGVESLAGSLKDKPLQSVVSDLRGLSQSNPTMLIAGSVMAGLALGRFLKSSAPKERVTPQQPMGGAMRYQPQRSYAGTAHEAPYESERDDLANADLFPEAGSTASSGGFGGQSTERGQ